MNSVAVTAYTTHIHTQDQGKQNLSMDWGLMKVPLLAEKPQAAKGGRRGGGSSHRVCRPCEATHAPAGGPRLMHILTALSGLRGLKGRQSVYRKWGGESGGCGRS